MTEESAAPIEAAEPVAVEPSSDAGSAVERAFRQVGLLDDAGETPARERDESGRFVAKPAEPVIPSVEAKPQPETKPEVKPEANDAPARFSPDAKAAWESAPPAVKAEVTRAIREMETGIQQYRETVEPLKPYIDMAGDARSLRTAIERYHGLEQVFAQDQRQGFEAVAKNLGKDFASVAKEYLGLPADWKPEGAQAVDPNVAALKSEVEALRQQLEYQQNTSILDEVQKFEAQNPRFKELADDIAHMLRTGFAEDLADAYAKAERLKPAQTAAQPQPTPEAQTQKALLSVQGAPASGSNPANRQRSATTHDAVARAFSQVGII